MKKSLIIIALLAIAATGFAQTTLFSAKLKKDKVPAEIITAIEEDFPDGEVTEFVGIPVMLTKDNWYVNVNQPADTDEFETYSVLIKNTKGNVTATYDKEGKLLHSSERLKNVPLSQPVQKSIAKHFPGWTAASDKLLVTHYEGGKQKIHYVVDLNDGAKNHRIVFDGNGNIIKGNEFSKHDGSLKMKKEHPAKAKK